MSFNKYCDYCGSEIIKEGSKTYCKGCGQTQESENSSLLTTDCNDNTFVLLYNAGKEILGDVLLNFLKKSDIKVNEKIKEFYPFVRIFPDGKSLKIDVESRFDDEYLENFLSILCKDYSFVKKINLKSGEDISYFFTDFNFDLIKKHDLFVYFSPYILCFDLPSKDRALAACALKEQGVAGNIVSVGDLISDDLTSLNLSLECLLLIAKRFNITDVKSCLKGWNDVIKNYNKLLEVKEE